jgi:hypothetical protein
MRIGWFALAGVLEAALTRKTHALATESHEDRIDVWPKRRGRTHSGTILLLLPFWGIAFSSCQAPRHMNQLTAEEAAYHEEITPLVTAACEIGMFRDMPDSYVVTGLEVPGYGEDKGAHSWTELHVQLDTLLPPHGLEDLHAALIDTLRFQLQLPETYPARVWLQSGSRLPSIDGNLAAHAKVACNKYSTFLDTVSHRQPANVTTSSSPTLAVSFQPTGSNLSLSLNSKGSFSVSVSDSISTPLGAVTLSASDSTASSARPTRLIINASGRRRVFLMDRPFKVFIPSEYGVSMANDGQQLTLDILGPPTSEVPPKIDLKALTDFLEQRIKSKSITGGEK